MELISAGSVDDSLMIVPTKFSNVARFLNGVNDKEESGRKRQNVRSIRVQVNGKVTVLLFTKRAV
eukprot:CAMPEP_0202976824 /NCGR_PEP_ID=MMETSP1396-20130829/80848_1 /ASSEMBLY_ACC=CAM_ASM_000872 /TAXON_ID= /ORGANISM="Pseudokeronopsis sp., Strain Brazil" /LENGTH=64 /DNA_ID=CAMNT_0049714837 /DNA_START=308 /DNA_END=498 /DNA_ORIENTATION=+